jgi:hypothetical protein
VCSSAANSPAVERGTGVWEYETYARVDSYSIKHGSLSARVESYVYTWGVVDTVSWSSEYSCAASRATVQPDK